MTGPIGGNRERQIQAWAKAKFSELDAADGDKDRTIKRDVWNSFVGSIGTGKTISIFITEDNAMKSLRTYARRADNGGVNNNETLLNELNSFVESNELALSCGGGGELNGASNMHSGPIDAPEAAESLKEHIDSFTLPKGLEAGANFDVSKIKENIQGAYAPEFSLNGAGKPANDAEKSVSLLLEAMQNAGSLSEKQRVVFAVKNVAARYPDAEICGQKCSDIAAFDNIKILQLFNVGHTGAIGQEITDTASCSDTKFQTIFNNVSKAQKFIQNNLGSMSEDELAQIGMTRDKCGRILQYINSIRYENDPLHDTMHGSNEGTIWVNSQLKGTENLENMVCMLIHEANHCDEAYLREFAGESEVGDLRHRDENGIPRRSPEYNTKEEERACERLGVLTTAKLIQKGVLKNDTYGRYNNHSFTEYLKAGGETLLDKDLNQWSGEGYSNYPEDFYGGITLEACAIKRHYANEQAYNQRSNSKIELGRGCNVQIGDNENFKLGENGLYLNSADSSEIFTLLDGNTLESYSNGFIILDELQPAESVKKAVGLENLVKTNTRVVITDKNGVKHSGYIYNMLTR